MKIILKLIVIGLILLTVVILFSTTETKYQCNGSMTKETKVTDSTIYLKFTEYRWWVHLWGNGSDGMMDLEIPGKTFINYNYVKRVGDQIQFSKDKGSLIGGYYSTLSGHSGVNDYFGVFEGECKVIDKK